MCTPVHIEGAHLIMSWRVRQTIIYQPMEVGTDECMYFFFLGFHKLWRTPILIEYFFGPRIFVQRPRI